VLHRAAQVAVDNMRAVERWLASCVVLGVGPVRPAHIAMEATMEQPPKNAAWERRVEFGDYNAGALDADGHGELTADAERVTDAVNAGGRAWEDTRRTVSRQRARRDGRKRALTRLVQEVRLKLAGEDMAATKREPYTLVFAEGADHFTKPRLTEVLSRTHDFKRRLVAYLAVEHPARTSHTPLIDAELAAFIVTSEALDEARGVRRRARNELDRIQEGFAKGMETIYGKLIALVGKAAAEDYFPSARTEDDEPELTEPTPTPT